MKKISSVGEFQERFSQVLQEVKEYVDEGEALEYVMSEYVNEINLFFSIINHGLLTEEEKIDRYNDRIEHIWEDLILDEVK